MPGPSFSRRRLLAGAAGVAGTAGLAGAAGLRAPGCDGAQGTSATASTGGAPSRLPFHGVHQTGITSPVPAANLLASFDVAAEGRDGLEAVLRALTDEVRSLVDGTPPAGTDEGDEAGAVDPPIDPGPPDEAPPPAGLTLTLSAGASLFDDRFGLADRRPGELVTMPRLANDRLDPARCHGDLLLSVAGHSPGACLFALRRVVRRTRGGLVPRWTVEGFDHRGAPDPGQPRPRASNLLGFEDGTTNLDTGDDDLLARHVWVGPTDGEPAWAVGGSYQAVRVIRLLVELWDATRLHTQEAVIGRHRGTGAPLGLADPAADPDYRSDPEGDRIPLDAHIRRANPRTAASEEQLLLRRGFSYSRGLDRAGQLDQGLAFVAFQRSLDRGFLAVQERLAGEALERYTRAEGGGFYFAFPGVRDEQDWFGRELLA